MGQNQPFTTYKINVNFLTNLLPSKVYNVADW